MSEPRGIFVDCNPFRGSNAGSGRDTLIRLDVGILSELNLGGIGSGRR